MKPMTTLIIVLACCAIAHGWLAAYFAHDSNKLPAWLDIVWRASWMVSGYAIVSTVAAFVASMFLHKP